ncbi:hypothetical protein Goshw_005495 [Gossypium schwendimanii]|uniref:Alpha/beta hydrolase fold-3 domain-containing protein n=1 Tax=Gossypium schwendimanii TaxID=34291 RepID=A0A7J9LKW0_GOSSC|nr:hypothetical protein [Gossypium schwendimanii]
MFGGQERTESERRLDGKYFVALRDMDWYWRAFLPEGQDRDHPACNPFGPNGRSLEGIKFPKSLVVVAGFDLIQDWQLAYVEGPKRLAKRLNSCTWNRRRSVSTCCQITITSTSLWMR